MHCSRCKATYDTPRLNASYCKPCWAAYYAEKHAKDPGPRRAAVRRWYGRNSEKVLEQMRLERRAAGVPERRVGNDPVKLKISRKRGHDTRRAKENGARGAHTIEEWERVLRDHGWRCVYCKTDLTQGVATRDHKIPLSRGGTDYIQNIVPACRSCNSRKQAKTFHEFKAYLRKHCI